jgi:hypothetical protein
MATINSNLITARANARTAPETIGAIGVSDMLVMIDGSFAITTALEAGDFINLVEAVEVPKGTVLDPHSSWLYCESTPGTSVIVDIGTTANDDRYADALTLVTGPANGPQPFSKNGTLVPASVANAKVENARIFATVKTATAPAACTVRFRLAFKSRV